jgi:hypothetical protein
MPPRQSLAHDTQFSPGSHTPFLWQNGTVGFRVGSLVGANVGFTVGDLVVGAFVVGFCVVGAFVVGADVGPDVGASDGAIDVVDAFVGTSEVDGATENVGVFDGISVGALDGTFDGAFVGPLVGAAVGVLVGAAVGLLVGAFVVWTGAGEGPKRTEIFALAGMVLVLILLTVMVRALLLPLNLKIV